MSAAAVDDLRDPRAAESAHRGIDRKAAATPRPFGIPVLLIAKLLARDRIARLLGKSGAVRGGVGDENQAGIERHIQPFVRVGRPGIGRFRALQQMAIALAGRGPESDRAVDMDPSLCRVGDRAGALKGVEHAGVQVSRLQADDDGHIAQPA